MSIRLGYVQRNIAKQRYKNGIVFVKHEQRDKWIEAYKVSKDVSEKSEFVGDDANI